MLIENIGDDKDIKNWIFKNGLKLTEQNSFTMDVRSQGGNRTVFHIALFS